VNFRAPAPGQTFIAPAEVPIVVDALDVDGEVRRVDFYADSRLLGTITQGPYGIVWSGAPPGIYTLTARATDNDGAMKTASTIVSIVSSNTPPFVQLTSPSEGEQFSAPAKVSLYSIAADSTGRIRQVDFFANGSLVGTVLSGPFTLVWSNVTAGAYTLNARAIDEFGVSATSAPVTITVTATVPAAFTNAIVLANRQFAFRITASANQMLVIQVSTNLTEWEPIATNNASNGLMDFIDQDTVHFSRRFYRATVKP